MSVLAVHSQAVVLKHFIHTAPLSLEESKHVFRWIFCRQKGMGLERSQDGRPGRQFELPRLRSGAQTGRISSTRPIRVPHRQSSFAERRLVMFCWFLACPNTHPRWEVGKFTCPTLIRTFNHQNRHNRFA